MGLIGLSHQGKKELTLMVSDNRVLRRIFAPKRAEVTGDWRKLQSEGLHDLYPLHNITRIIKSRMKCTGHEG
jgi:hypothetical protein